MYRERVLLLCEDGKEFSSLQIFGNRKNVNFKYSYAFHIELQKHSSSPPSLPKDTLYTTSLL